MFLGLGQGAYTRSPEAGQSSSAFVPDYTWNALSSSDQAAITATGAVRSNVDPYLISTGGSNGITFYYTLTPDQFIALSPAVQNDLLAADLSPASIFSMLSTDQIAALDPTIQSTYASAITLSLSAPAVVNPATPLNQTTVPVAVSVPAPSGGNALTAGASTIAPPPTTLVPSGGLATTPLPTCPWYQVPLAMGSQQCVNNTTLIYGGIAAAALLLYLFMGRH